MADFPVYAAMQMSPRAVFVGGPYDLNGAWGEFCHEVASWSLFGHGGLAICRKGDGAVMGTVQINAGPLFPETELGWQLFDGYEGQGYATEAARAFRDWAFAHLPLESLVSYTDPANTASHAVAKRLGAVVDPAASRQDPEDLVWRHSRGSA
jgi:RimJ/RimL family protein N-acetyltransferase